VSNLHNVKDAKLDKFNAGAYADAIAQAAKAVDAIIISSSADSKYLGSH
jgi:electron transfer flavoprotein alpha subunit